MYYTDAETTFQEISAFENPESSEGWEVSIPTTDTDGKEDFYRCNGFTNKKEAEQWAIDTIENIKEENNRHTRWQQVIISKPVYTKI